MRSIGFFIASTLSSGLAAHAVAAPDATVSLQAVPAGTGIVDYANAKPLPLPMARRAPSKASTAVSLAFKVKRPGSPGVVAGKAGTGQEAPVRLFTGKPNRGVSAGGVQPEQTGLAGQPFTTSRANIEGMKPAKGYPFTAIGRLFFNIDGLTYVCSASMIKPGVVVTAAHCVSNFGDNSYHTDFQYVPVYSNGVAPFGVWTPQFVAAHTKYLNGTTTCWSDAPGVVCEDDVAVMVLTPKNGKFAGQSTGYLGYGWDGASFNDDNLALLTQFGYPVDSDGGEIMQRTDSQAFVDPEAAGNTILGSEQRGGSSGGPWVADWGIAAKGGVLRPQPPHNVVVGVTSWGFTDPRYKQQGASPFLSTNIVPLVNAACAAVPAACVTN
ncbi:MAG TPA: trypsin-like serine protease [Ideonella sp.]|nr:trypsin-like serine protease [Ideonella sp.]